MTGFLASVASVDEMDVALRSGAGIVDLKNPTEGALGAWSAEELRAGVARWRSWPEPRPMLSATIGDQPMNPRKIRSAARAVAETGAPMVKLGVFPGGDPRACLSALEPLARTTALVAVFFADKRPDFALLDAVAASGFRGAMLDTADKSGGGLRSHLDEPTLSAFVGRVQDLGLLAGLAGSLSRDDAAALAPLGADYLGFRGALCAGGRTGRIDERASAEIAAKLRELRKAA